jgi:hypothetical protein
MMRRGLSLALTVCFVAGFAACSGDDDDGAGGLFQGDDDQSTDDPTADDPAADDPTPVVPRGEVQSYEVEDKNHVDTRVDYEQTPPVGGNHAQVWQNCGFYEDPIVAEAGVHSLEHGAVWITFQPDLPADQVAVIESLAEQPYTLASPWGGDDLPAPVVLSAWGKQVQLDNINDPVALQFLAEYRESLDAPEPGAPCDGGTTFTE